MSSFHTKFKIKYCAYIAELEYTHTKYYVGVHLSQGDKKECNLYKTN